MNHNLSILIIDSSDKAVNRLRSRLEEAGFSSVHSASPEATVDELDRMDPGLFILGPSLTTEATLNCMDKAKILDPLIPVLTMCKRLELPQNPENIPYEGARYVSQSKDPQRLAAAVEEAVADRTAHEQAPEFPVIIGRSAAIIEVRRKIRTVADKDITVLITGETGTGKELIARAIHYYSARNKGPLVKINCGALPDELLESEVFGFEKGAFTGAHKDKPGRFETAEGGTLFIDEIGDLPLHLQAKFFQVLEDKAVSRLGGTEDTVVDARVVAATNMDLLSKMKEGNFRKDLFYRLNVVHLHAAPLRARPEDIHRLIHYFMNKYCFEFKREPLELPENISNFFMAYRWPGNVRELENVVRRAIVLRDWHFIFKELSASHVDYDKKRAQDPEGNPAQWPEARIRRMVRESDFALKKLTKAYVSDAEREAILKTLRETDWNRKRAAKLLKVSYKTLLNRIEEFGLKP